MNDEGSIGGDVTSSDGVRTSTGGSDCGNFSTGNSDASSIGGGGGVDSLIGGNDNGSSAFPYLLNSFKGASFLQGSCGVIHKHALLFHSEGKVGSEVCCNLGYRMDWT